MKTLQVAIGQQHDIRDAFAEYGEVIYWDWSGRNHSFCYDIRKIVDDHNPDLVFLQIQTPGIIDAYTAQYLATKATVVNWTGDVRHPTPRWFYDVGRQIHMTYFTNMHDVNVLRKQGINADYLQIGVPDKIFKPDGEKREEAEIVFMGNNIGGFPLSPFRINVVDRLSKRYGSRFKAYGLSWGRYGYGHEPNQHEEAKIYRGAKIGINLSHYDYPRYSSDRILRLMGAGCFCLSHKYQDIEHEFEIGKHLDVWTSLDDLVSKIDYWLERDEERSVIAKEGSKHVHANHTWRNRMPEIMKLMKA